MNLFGSKPIEPLYLSEMVQSSLINTIQWIWVYLTEINIEDYIS